MKEERRHFLFPCPHGWSTSGQIWPQLSPAVPRTDLVPFQRDQLQPKVPLGKRSGYHLLETLL